MEGLELRERINFCSKNHCFSSKSDGFLSFVRVFGQTRPHRLKRERLSRDAAIRKRTALFRR